MPRVLVENACRLAQHTHLILWIGSPDGLGPGPYLFKFHWIRAISFNIALASLGVFSLKGTSLGRIGPDTLLVFPTGSHGTCMPFVYIAFAWALEDVEDASSKPETDPPAHITCQRQLYQQRPDVGSKIAAGAQAGVCFGSACRAGKPFSQSVARPQILWCFITNNFEIKYVDPLTGISTYMWGDSSRREAVQEVK